MLHAFGCCMEAAGEFEDMKPKRAELGFHTG